LLIFPSTIFLLFGGFTTAVRPNEPAFRRAAEVATFEFLAQHATSGEVVLASYATSNALPAWAPLNVLIGHGPESANLRELMPRVERFYQPATADEERRNLLQEFNIRYVFRGPAEFRLGKWDMSQNDRLKLIYEENGYSIYKVDVGE
jgi:uncharacterized membrane protein